MTAQEFIKFPETEKLKLLKKKGDYYPNWLISTSYYRLYAINNFHVEVRKDDIDQSFPKYHSSSGIIEN